MGRSYTPLYTIVQASDLGYRLSSAFWKFPFLHVAFTKRPAFANGNKSGEDFHFPENKV